MRVQIKDLKPNPFRDMVNYPINPEKISSLTKSINQTGFWDNIVGRKNNGNIEIAYGHHRLVVLEKLFKPNDFVDIPIRELDDEIMIKIMANENDESWKTNPKIINETVKVTKKFLDANPEISIKYMDEKSVKRKHIEKCLKSDTLGNVSLNVSYDVISRFLGGNWNTTRVQFSLERLGFGKTKDIDTKATEILETDGQARTFVKAKKKVKGVTPKQQRKAAKKIVKEQRFDELSMRDALINEMLKDKKIEPTEEEIKLRTFERFVEDLASETRKLHGKYLKLFEVNKELKPEFKMCRGSLAVEELAGALYLLIDVIKIIWKEVKNKNGKGKKLSITN